MTEQEQKAVEEAARKFAGCENNFNCGRCPEHERQYECGKYLQKESFVEGAQFLSDLRKSSAELVDRIEFILQQNTYERVETTDAGKHSEESSVVILSDDTKTLASKIAADIF